MISNFKKIPDHLIVDLVNETNDSDIPYQAVTVSQSSDASGDGKSRDTKTTVTAVDGEGYIDSQVVYYNRKPITDLLPEDVEYTVETLPTSAEEARIVINALPDANWLIEAENPEELTLTLDDSESANRQVSLTIVYSDTAKVFKGSTRVKLVTAGTPLSSVITNDVLTGFVN